VRPRGDRREDEALESRVGSARDFARHEVNFCFHTGGTAGQLSLRNWPASDNGADPPQGRRRMQTAA
jgi:hypothetical protein